jgi:hypothetical protein
LGEKKNKTVQIEIGLSENGGNPCRTINRSIFFSGQKSIMPIVEIVFPQSIYRFHCTIPNNAGGGRNYFYNCRHPSPKLILIVDSTLMYCNSTNWLLVQPLSQLTHFAVFNAHPPLLECHGEKKSRFLNFDVWREGRLSGRPFCSCRIPRVRFLSEQSSIRSQLTRRR